MPYTVMTTTRDPERDRDSTIPQPNSTKRILFANAKGGCGKSTLATNLASTYANADMATALIDYDPQGSASQWLKLRPQQLKSVYGIDAFRKENSNTTGNWFMRLPRDVRRVIVDTPAGLQGAEFQEQIHLADVIIVPVLPSPIDIHSATRFIGSILLSSEYRQRRTPKQLLVLANRTRKNTRVLNKLDLFLASLRLPRVGNIRDTQQYVQCSDSGTGIVDISGSRHLQDRQHWLDLKDWLEAHFDACDLPPDSNTPQPAGNTTTSNTYHETKEQVYTVR